MKERLQKKIKKLQKEQKSGFTLIELIVVLVILGIILAITVPAVTSYIDDANDAKYVANARAVFIAAEAERTRAIANDASLATENWPNTDGSVDATMDTTIETKSTIAVQNVKYDKTSKKYTFSLMDGDEVLRSVTVDPNKDIKVVKP